MSTINSQDYFRRLTVGETLQRLAALYFSSARARLFIKLAVLLVVPITLVGMIIVNYVTTHLIDDGGDVWKNALALFIIAASKLFFHNCAAIIADAAIVYTVAELYVGNARPSWTTALHTATRQAPVLFVAGLLQFIGVGVGYLCLAVLGIWMAVCLALVTPVIVVEGPTTAVAALQRSVALTQGYRWHILACLTILYLLKYALMHVLNAVLAFHSTTPTYYHMWFTVGGSFLSLLPASIFVPAVAILKAVVYLSIRGDKENLTAETLMEELGHRSLLSPSEIFAYQEVSTTPAADDDHVSMVDTEASE